MYWCPSRPKHYLRREAWQRSVEISSSKRKKQLCFASHGWKSSIILVIGIRQIPTGNEWPSTTKFWLPGPDRMLPKLSSCSTEARKAKQMASACGELQSFLSNSISEQIFVFKKLAGFAHSGLTCDNVRLPPSEEPSPPNGHNLLYRIVHNENFSQSRCFI